MQTVFSALIVAGCTGYAVWTLLPASARRRVQSALGKPTAATRGCGGCAGCDHGAGAAGATRQVVRWVPRQRG